MNRLRCWNGTGPLSAYTPTDHLAALTKPSGISPRVAKIIRTRCDLVMPSDVR